MIQKNSLLLLSCLVISSTPLLTAADSTPGIPYSDPNPPGSETRRVQIDG